ncbi:transporter [Amylibacter marinus]|uniref:Transporter n=1 Tax=Amylibacter marinus TaxID=1475483 RepID=A0ABQ5VVV5_9RHOB|nr:AEC family transporter [Amylibacter marinus]GLQ35422.1 transporter [Amylibacter marinus]
MDIIFTVLEIVAPVFLLACIGFGWVKYGWAYEIEFVTRIAMTLSVPALIFVALMKSQVAPDALSALFLASLVCYGLLIVVFWLVLWLGGMDLRTNWAPLIFGNTGNLGLPLALFAFGDEGLSYAVIVFAVMAILSFSVGVWMVSGGGGFTKMIKEPIVWGTLLGGLFLVQGWETPDWATNSLELLGQMAIPLMLITLGVSVARLQVGTLGRGAVLVALKTVLCVAVAWGVGRYFALDPVAFAVLVVQISTPVAVTSYLLAQKYGADADQVAGMVIISTLLSVITLPALLVVLI